MQRLSQTHPSEWPVIAGTLPEPALAPFNLSSDVDPILENDSTPPGTGEPGSSNGTEEPGASDGTGESGASDGTDESGAPDGTDESGASDGTGESDEGVESDKTDVDSFDTLIDNADLIDTEPGGEEITIIEDDGSPLSAGMFGKNIGKSNEANKAVFITFAIIAACVVTMLIGHCVSQTEIFRAYVRSSSANAIRKINVHNTKNGNINCSRLKFSIRRNPNGGISDAVEK